VATPFLKWPGGKRWLVPYISALLDGVTFDRYIEPFVGGGAVFFGLEPEKAILADINSELIGVYTSVRDNYNKIVDEIERLPVDKETYISLRDRENCEPLEQAVRFLYLNRTAFGGMYRLNQQGRFNVPFGGGERSPRVLWTTDILKESSGLLQRAEVGASDFETTLARAGEGDLVYCDPTYTVTHNNNGFVRYNEQNFSWADQIRLARLCREAAARGAIVLVSNALHADVAALYAGTEGHAIGRVSCLCPDGSRRRPTREYLFVLWPPGAKRRRRRNGLISGMEATVSIVRPSKSYLERSPYRDALLRLKRNRVLEVERREGESLRSLKSKIKLASNDVHRPVMYGEGDNGNLVVWLADSRVEQP
jgi:DNA adenine methylase